MSIPFGYFRNIFKNIKVHRSSEGFEVNYDVTALGEKLDIVQDELDNQVWHDMRMYMPHQSGELIRRTGELNEQVRGEVYIYDPTLPYSHYQYEGIKYVDPQYGIGAFYDPNYGYWSRKGVPKIPSSERLNYTQPSAVSHWDEVAVANHEKQWTNLVKRSLKRII